MAPNVEKKQLIYQSINQSIKHLKFYVHNNRAIFQVYIWNANDLIGGGWAGRGQDNFLSLGRETILEGGLTTLQGHDSMEMKREHYHIVIFPKYLKLNSKKEEDKRTP